MSGLSEAELHVQAMRLVCEALADREQQGIEVDWDVLRQMHDQMDAMLQDLWHKHRYDSSEMVDLRKDRDAARAEIETLRKELAATNRFASTVASERDAAHAAATAQQRDEIACLRARLDEERSVSAGLREQLADAQRAVSDAFAEVNSVRQQLDAAQAAVTLQRAGIERLQAFVSKVRERVTDMITISDVKFLHAALAELAAEPTPVAEPLDAEVERLRAFVEIMRGLLTAEYADQRIIAAAIAELDDANSSATLTSSPTPVAEPVPCPECERLQVFEGKVRMPDCYREVIKALAELDDEPTEPTPVAERCPECDGSGMVDSGGFGPDGKGINVPCGGDCRGNPCPSQPTPVAEPLDPEGGA